MRRDFSMVRRLFVALLVLIYVVELAACAARSPGSATAGPATTGGATTKPATTPPATTSDRARPRGSSVYVDPEAARLAASQSTSPSASALRRGAVLRDLQRHLERALGANETARDDALQRVELETLAAIRKDERLAQIHPKHVAARAALTRILLDARDARLERSAVAEDSEFSAAEFVAPLELCLTKTDFASFQTLLTPGCSIDRVWAREEQLSACAEYRAEANGAAADRWLALLAATSQQPACGDAYRTFVRLHTDARWREFEQSGDFEALITAREALWQRFLHDESLLGPIDETRARDLPRLVGSLDRLDAELLRQREATWRRLVLEADPVFGDARARARRDIGGGLAMIIVGGAMSLGAFTGLGLFSAFAGLYSALPFAGTASVLVVVVLLGVKFLRQGLRVARAFGATPRGDRGPPHWFQPGVGRRLRDPSGLYVIDSPTKSVAPGR
jgi:hypothetical protein